MNNDLQIFNYNSNDVRIIEKDGQPWFVAKDVCDILRFGNARQAIATHVEENEKDDVQILDAIGRKQSTTIINEGGLYALIFQSNKPEAKRFSKWVRSEVLPSIRKHGAYITPDVIEKTLTNPDFIISLAQQLKEERAKSLALQSKIDADKPKVIFADAVDASEQSILIGDLSKLIAQNGYNISPHKLFKFLRENGYLIKQKGASWNMPTQKSISLGFFEIKERVINNPDGSSRLTRTPKVTGKGQVFFINYFLGGDN